MQIGDVGAVLDGGDFDVADASAEFLYDVQKEVVGERPADILGVDASGNAGGLLEADEDR